MRPDPASEGAARWRFVPRSEAALSREEQARAASKVRAAIRAGHGLGAVLELVFTSGPEPSIDLLVQNVATQRWVERVLPVAYDAGQWRRGPPPGEPPGSDRRAGRRIALPGERTQRAPEEGAIAGTAALAMSSVRPGVRLACSLSPLRERFVPLFGIGSANAPDGRPNGRTGENGSPRERFPGRISAEENGPLWRASAELSLPLDIADSERARAILAAEAAWRHLDGAGLRFSRWYRWLGAPSGFAISSGELAALFPSPDCGSSIPPGGTGEGTGLPLGRTVAGTVVSSPVEMNQGRHLAVLGETGMGKSSLLVALAVRAARLGGIVVLDPLGETAREIRTEVERRGEEPLWIAPEADAPSINALEGIDGGALPDPVRAERRVADLVHALRRVRAGRYAESTFWGPRLEEMLSRAVRVAASFPDGTLADAHTLLATAGITRRPIPPGAEEGMRELAQRIRQRPDDADGARRLLYEVVRNPTLGRMLCARTPELSASEFVRPGRIVLVSGEAALVGESTARYLLAVYLALVWSELLVGGARTKTFVVLDEAQWFAHESLAEMLRLARRRNVHVILATQSIASLPENVREAVWTNVADFALFRGLPEEAREFARAAPGVTAQRLLALPRGAAAVLVGKGSCVRWVRTARLPRRSDGPPDPRRTDESSGTLAPAGPAPAPTLAAGPHLPDDPTRGITKPVPTDEVLAWLLTRAPGGTADPLLRLPVAELRSRYPQDPDLVRRIGSRLGRTGGLRRTERSADGPIWWLDPERVAAMALEPCPPSARDSEEPQPS